MFGKAIKKRLLRPLAERKRQWEQEDLELERFCRFEEEERGSGVRIDLMADPPDPWTLALRSLRPRRKYEQNDD